MVDSARRSLLSTSPQGRRVHCDPGVRASSGKHRPCGQRCQLGVPYVWVCAISLPQPAHLRRLVYLGTELAYRNSRERARRLSSVGTVAGANVTNRDEEPPLLIGTDPQSTGAFRVTVGRRQPAADGRSEETPSSVDCTRRGRSSNRYPRPRTRGRPPGVG